MLEITQSILNEANFILASANILIAFSLLLYLLANNFRNSVARGFAALLLFVVIVYVGNVFLLRVIDLGDAELWLRFKWIGISFVPAGYLHFSITLLRSTGVYSRLRRFAVFVGYITSAAFLLLVVFTNLVVCCATGYSWGTQFRDGPLFWLFTLYFYATTIWGFYNIWNARRRALTATSRRRMTYLTVAFLAPALGVFPYLIITSIPADTSPLPLYLATLVVHIGIALMMIVMGYTVAYQGAFVPDRIVKHRLIHFLLRGPFVATCVVIALTIVPPIERMLGLTRETMLFATVMIGIVVFELIIMLFRRLIDRVIFSADRQEIDQIQELESRLLTTTDLRQLLENALAALCDLLRVHDGFVASRETGEWRIEALTGSPLVAEQILSTADIAAISAAPPEGNGLIVPLGGNWIFPLRSQTGDLVVGIFGIPKPPASTLAATPELDEREHDLAEALIRQAELALEDRHLQQNVFRALQPLNSEIELLQRARSKPRYAGAIAQERLEEEIIPSADFHRAVKDALDHYWGGPKLTDSPLLALEIVRASLPIYDYNAVRALRGVLADAIESLRPDGERSLTAPEWVLYNILELKILQGMKVRDIALRLAMSESDLYRKQRFAIQEIARTVQQREEMERMRKTNGEPTSA